jgi:hypothetical protein
MHQPAGNNPTDYLNSPMYHKNDFELIWQNWLSFEPNNQFLKIELARKGEQAEKQGSMGCGEVTFSLKNSLITVKPVEQ